MFNKILDSFTDLDRLAETLISQRDVWDLQEHGTLKLSIPVQYNSISLKSLKKSVESRIEDLWDDSQTGVEFPLPKFDIQFDEPYLTVNVI